MEADIIYASLTILVEMTLSGVLILGNMWGYKNILSEFPKHKMGRYLLYFVLSYLLIGIYAFYLLRFGYDYVALTALISYLITIVPEDVKVHKISGVTTLIFAVIFVVLRLITRDIYELADGATGFIFGGISLGIPFLIKREWIGVGDILTVAVCGIILGFFGIVQFLIRTFVFIVIYSVILLIRKKASMKSELPFAPFLLIAAII